jgi:hypothetical protein
MSDSDIVWVASFDIGKKNFAFYIEEFNKSDIMNLPRLPIANRYNPDGTTTPAFESIIKKVCVNGKSIIFQNTDLTDGCKKGSYLDPETYHNMTDLLDKYVDYWDQCDAFVIEKQMSFGKRHNTMALKLGQHCWSYFAFKYGRFKEIIEFPAYHKTQILGAKKIEKISTKGKSTFKAIDKPARKKWSIEKAMNILKERKDLDTIASLTSSRKRDDLADVLCQLQAFKILVYIDKKL